MVISRLLAIGMTNLVLKKNGFTLIEVLVVLVIISIILTFAVISFGDFGKSREQQAQVVQLQSSIRAAQAQAILMPNTLQLTINSHGYRYQRAWYDLKRQQQIWRNLNDDALSQPKLFAQGTEVKLSSKSKSIQFNPNGIVTTFRVQVTFPNNKHYLLSVDSSGASNLEKG